MSSKLEECREIAAELDRGHTSWPGDCLRWACDKIEALEAQNKDLKEHWPEDLYGVRMFANADVACRSALKHIEDLESKLKLSHQVNLKYEQTCAKVLEQRDAAEDILTCLRSVLAEEGVKDKLSCYMMGHRLIELLEAIDKK